MLKKTLLISGISAGILLCSCQNKASTASESPVIGKQTVSVKDGKLSPEALWALGRLGEIVPSPDGSKIVYGVSYYSIAENKGNTDLYIMDQQGDNLRQITKTPESEFNICWNAAGTKILFLKGTSDGAQVFEMNPDGSEVSQLSQVKGGMDGFKLSPDETKIAFIQQVSAYKSIVQRYPDLPKASGLIFNDLNYKHWDEYNFTIPHIFIGDFKDGKVSNAKDILLGEAFEAPVKPFGGIEQYNWSPDNQNLAYTSKKLVGKAYAFSTNTDIFIYNLASGQTSDLSKGMPGYDMNPVYSPNGQYIAWESMSRDGYESDKNRLMICDLSNNTITDYTLGFDQNASNLRFDPYSQNVYFLSDFHARDQIYCLNIASKKIRAITQGDQDYTSIHLLADGKQIVATKMSLSSPLKAFLVNIQTGDQTQITFFNHDILTQLNMGRVEGRWIKTTDNQKMLTWVVYPPDFDSTKSYPALLYCEGGPQSTVSQFWSYRWNLQIMAANGYIVVAPNRRGLPGFGQKWNEQISGDYGGQNMNDYLSAIDALSKEPYVDKNRLGCVGASYGGFSVYWLAGHHNKRFKGFIAHDGMFNFNTQYLETEEMWFVNWDLGGPFWDKNNKIAQKSYANSPDKFVDKWDTPIMIIHGEKDYRILASQGMSAFNTAIIRGLDAELLLFPDENHWVLKPQNGILWQRRFFKFLDTHVKKASAFDLANSDYSEQPNTDSTAAIAPLPVNN